MLTQPDPGNPHGWSLQREGDGDHESGGFCISHMSGAVYLLCILGGISKSVSFHHWHSKYLCV